MLSRACGYSVKVKEFGADPKQAFPGHGQQKPEQLEIERLRREVTKLKAERYSTLCGRTGLLDPLNRDGKATAIRSDIHRMIKAEDRLDKRARPRRAIATPSFNRLRTWRAISTRSPADLS